MVFDIHIVLLNMMLANMLAMIYYNKKWFYLWQQVWQPCKVIGGGWGLNEWNIDSTALDGLWGLWYDIETDVSEHDADDVGTTRTHDVRVSDDMHATHDGWNVRVHVMNVKTMKMNKVMMHSW